MGITITPPATMDTPLKQWRWTHRANNRMTLLHNWMGEWFTQGKTLDEYNALMPSGRPVVPAFIKAKFQHTGVNGTDRTMLSASAWDHFVRWHFQYFQALSVIQHESRPAQPNLTQAEQDALSAEVDAAAKDNTLPTNFDGTTTEA